MPSEPSVAVLSTRLEDAAGTVLHRNFTTFVVEGDAPREMRLADGRSARIARVNPPVQLDFFEHAILFSEAGDA